MSAAEPDLDTWPLVRAFQDATPSARSAVVRASFDRFLKTGIERALAEGPPIRTRGDGDVRAVHVRAHPPKRTPAACRLLDQTYATSIVADIVRVSDGTTIARDVRLGEIPLMVGCAPCPTANASAAGRRAVCECPRDSGGYFIVEGKEKAVASVVEVSVDAIIHRTARATTDHPYITISAFAGACFVSAELPRGYTTDKLPVNSRAPAIALAVPSATRRIARVPIAVAMRALGTATDRDLVTAVAACSCGALTVRETREVLAATLAQAADAGPLQTTALAAVAALLGSANGAKGALRAVRTCVPDAADDAERAMSLAYVLAQCVQQLLGRPGQVTERDSYEAKSVVTPGAFFARTFAARWSEHALRVAAHADAADDARTAIEHALFDVEMESTFVKTLRSSAETSPIFDVPRYTPHGAAAYSARIVNPVPASEIDTRGPHRVHSTQFGFVCPIETPEGIQVGLANSYATMADVSGAPDASVIAAVREALDSAGARRAAPTSADLQRPGGTTPVLLDGVTVGFAKEPHGVAAHVRARRRAGALPRSIGVSWRLGGPVHVRASAGRLIRPLIVREMLDDQDTIGDISRRGTSWDECTRAKEDGAAPLIEYVDVAESACAMTAPSIGALRAAAGRVQYTHVEIHPTAILSHVAAMTPFSDRNPAPRNVFSCKQTKACTSVYATNFRSRMDTSTHVLHAGQSAIVDTAWSASQGARELPYGVNAIVAIATFTGYNQEDAIILNAASVARGLFATTHITTLVRDENPRDGGVFCDPSSRAIEARAASYTDIGADGLPKQGSRVHAGNAIIGHVTGNERDTSTLCDLTVHGTVHVAMMSEKGGAAGRRAKVCLYDTRAPRVGDKFSSRHGQKGICARIASAEDLPVTADGTVPDLIINPHALPSRMTIGQLLEGVAAKAACIEGESFVDATGSCAESCESFASRLAPHAEMFGSEVMFDPRTGRMQDAAVTVCPTFYMRLVQMVADKVNISRNGSTRRDARTGQPVRGRAEAGALRIGEMETNACLAHGAASFLHETFTVKSDGAREPGTVFVDGRIAVPTADGGTVPLRDSGWMTDRTIVPADRVPRAFALFQDEAAGMGVAIDALPAEIADGATETGH